MRSNCFIFALQRFRKKGGFVIWRRSHWGFWWHFLWSRDLKQFEEFTPIIPNHRKASPPILFRGKVRISTAEEQGH